MGFAENNTSIQKLIFALTRGIQGPTPGTLMTTQIQKVGTLHGKGEDKKVYGDDVVQVLLWTGFPYTALVKKSLDVLEWRINRGRYIENTTREARKQHPDVSIADVCHALQEVRESFRRKLSFDPSAEKILGSNPQFWRPLYYANVEIPGCWVYQGGDGSNPRAPEPGTIFVQGLKLGQRVVTPAANGAWVTEHRPKTVAKNVIREGLPLHAFRQYRLDPSRVFSYAFGESATHLASKCGITVQPQDILNLLKV